MSRWDPPLWLDRLAGVAWRFVAIVVSIALLVAGAVLLSSVIVPVLLGLLFACGLHPLSERLRRAHLPAGLAAGLPILGLMVALGAVAWLTVATVVDQWDEITAIVATGKADLQDVAVDGGLSTTTAASLAAGADDLVTTIARPLLQGIVHVVPTVAGLAAALVLSLLAGLFFLKDGPAMWRWIVGRLGSGGDVADHTGRRAWTTLSAYVRGQAAIAAIDATGIALGAMVVGVPQPAAIFMLTFLGAFIPFIGAFLSGMVAVLLALGDAGVAAGLVMLVVVLVVQVIEGNVLQPWIQGKAVTLHPLVIALSVAAGGAIAGFLGVLLAVPVTASLVVAVSELRIAGVIGSGDGQQ